MKCNKNDGNFGISFPVVQVLKTCDPPDIAELQLLISHSVGDALREVQQHLDTPITSV